MRSAAALHVDVGYVFAASRGSGVTTCAQHLRPDSGNFEQRRQQSRYLYRATACALGMGRRQQYRHVIDDGIACQSASSRFHLFWSANQNRGK